MKKGQIFIKGNKIVSVKTNTLWNQEPWTTVAISLEPNGDFKSCVSSPGGWR